MTMAGWAKFPVVIIVITWWSKGEALPLNPCLSNPTNQLVTFTDAKNCTNYYLCNAQHLAAKLSCRSDEAFDSGVEACVPRASAWAICGDAPPPKNPCASNKNKVYITSVTNCTEYHICSKSTHMATEACPTNQHFNDQTFTCVPKNTLRDICNKRVEKVASTVAPRTRRTHPVQTHPPINPCQRMSAGHMYHVTDRSDCRQYHVCVDNDWRALLNCGDDDRVFNDEKNVCVIRGSPLDICKGVTKKTTLPTTVKKVTTKTSTEPPRSSRRVTEPQSTTEAKKTTLPTTVKKVTTKTSTEPSRSSRRVTEPQSTTEAKKTTLPTTVKKITTKTSTEPPRSSRRVTKPPSKTGAPMKTTDGINPSRNTLATKDFATTATPDTTPGDIVIVQQKIQG